MTRRGAALCCMTLTALVCALSTGSQVYYLAALCFALSLCWGLVSILWAGAVLRVESRLHTRQVLRGEDAQMFVTLRCPCMLPLSALQITAGCGGEEITLRCVHHPLRDMQERAVFTCAHVGMFHCKVQEVRVQDLFGLFSLRKKGRESDVLFVLPKPFDIDKPTFALGDTGNAALSRTQEDYTSPEDVRPYIPGDAMKRIHWKLSSRKRELLVRRYETPAPPDTLILVDPNVPKGAQGEQQLSLRDAICETAVAVAALQLGDQSPVRAPFYGPMANEFSADTGAQLSLLQEMLAMQPFDGQDHFARSLHMELRRMGRTGAAIVITTRLDAKLVDAISHMRRMGPHVRLYLVTYTPEEEGLRPYVTQLQHHLVEVCYVTPA